MKVKAKEVMTTMKKAGKLSGMGVSLLTTLQYDASRCTSNCISSDTRSRDWEYVALYDSPFQQI